jgi:hypothetical protein
MSPANPNTDQRWILLIHQLPPRPTNLRVRIWRKLQKLGAVAIKNSVYVLPANEQTHEDFQWLKKEIESAGGEAAVFRAASVEGATDAEIIQSFRKARNDEFALITADLDGLAGAIREQARGKHLSPGRLAAHETELGRLHAELERVTANDFFNASGRSSAVAAYERCHKVIQTTRSPTRKLSRPQRKSGVLDISAYQNRRWVTRPDLHIDRLASAWLIKQFIDKQPRFYFTGEDGKVDGAVTFDMFDAEFTHQDEDCTFETIMKRFGLSEIKGLRELAEIVHDIDLKDDKFHRLEAPGLNAIISGLSQTVKDDRKRIQHASVIFDGLFSLLGKTTVEKATAKAGRKRRVSRNR